MSWKSRVQPKLDVESMEDRLLLAGDVRVRVDGDTLVITGDSDDNAVLVRQGDRRNSFVVTGISSGDGADGATNLINRRGNAVDELTVRGIRNINIRMGSGDDQVYVSGISESRAVGTRSAGPLRGDLSINLGSGEDRLFIGAIFGQGGGDPIDLDDLPPGLPDVTLEDIFDCIPEGAIDETTGAVSFDDLDLDPNQDIVDPVTGDIIGVVTGTPINIGDIQFDPTTGEVVTDPVTGAVLDLAGNPILGDGGLPIETADLGFASLDDLIESLPETADIDTVTGALDFASISGTLDPAQTFVDETTGELTDFPGVNIEDIQFDPTTGEIVTDPVTGEVLDVAGNPLLSDPTDLTSPPLTLDDLGFDSLDDITAELPPDAIIDPVTGALDFESISDLVDDSLGIVDVDTGEIIGLVTTVPLNLEDIQFDPETGDIVTDIDGSILGPDGEPILDEFGDPINIDDLPGGFVNLEDILEDCFELVENELGDFVIDPDSVTVGPGGVIEGIPAGGILDDQGNVLIDETGTILDEAGDPILVVVDGVTRNLNIFDLVFNEDGDIVDIGEDIVTPGTGPVGNDGIAIPNLVDSRGRIVNAVSVADDMRITAGSGDDFIQIAETYVGDDFDLNAGSGNDDVLLLDTATNPDQFKPSLRVRGDAEFEMGSGDDTLVVFLADFRGDFEADGGRGDDSYALISSRGASRRDFDNFENELDELDVDGDDDDDLATLRRRRR